MTKGELTRKRIVEAAAPIFNRCGYEGSSLNALMEATGLKKGGIYLNERKAGHEKNSMYSRDALSRHPGGARRRRSLVNACSEARAVTSGCCCVATPSTMPPRHKTRIGSGPLRRISGRELGGTDGPCAPGREPVVVGETDSRRSPPPGNETRLRKSRKR